MRSNFPTVLLFISLINCLAGSNNVIPYTTHYQNVAFVLRGGGEGSYDDSIYGNVNVDGNNAPSSDNHRQFIGVIDLRPTPDPDSIILLNENRCGDDSADVTYDVVQEALFPTTKHRDDEIISDVVDDAEMDQQAASSHSIGNSCSTVYLIIAYDFENGKTALHRSFGGTKLMAFVDGVRNRVHHMSQINPHSDAATKLILLLVPSSSSSATTLLSRNYSTENILLSDTSKPLPNKIVLNLTKVNSDTSNTWDSSGAYYLVERLSEAFSLGGDNFQNVDQFEVEIIGAFSDKIGEEEGIGREEGEENEHTETADHDVSEIIVRHILCSLRDDRSSDSQKGGDTVIHSSSIAATSSANKEFQGLVRQRYEAAGGIGNINFQ